MKRYLILLIAAITACAPDPPAPPPRVKVRFAALPATVVDPPENPTTPAKVALGRLLFFDPILSGDRDVACATCHHPANGWAEFRDISIGVNGEGFGSRRRFRTPNDIPFVRRNAHTILNVAFNGMDHLGRYAPARAPMFWDARAAGLEEQALQPLLALEEMRGRGHGEADILAAVERRLRGIPAYVEHFRAAFGAGVPVVTSQRVARAIAAFERTLVATDSRFDRYLRGDRDALSTTEREGLALFRDRGCANCHNGPMLSDYQLHVLGVPENDRLPAPDSSGQPPFALRTPSMRNLRHTAPYMHNGSLPTLMSVLEFYEDVAGGKQRNPHVPPGTLAPLARELTLRARDMRPIISFLNALNDDNFDRSEPDAVPSGLPVGGNIHP